MSLAPVAAAYDAEEALCAHCAADLVHCHGTAMQHFDGLVDCLEDASCTLTGELHAFVVPCLLAGCDCDTGP